MPLHLPEGGRLREGGEGLRDLPPPWRRDAIYAHDVPRALAPTGRENVDLFASEALLSLDDVAALSYWKRKDTVRITARV